MKCTYKVRKDVVIDEEGIEHTVFGIDAVNFLGRVVKSVSDIYFDSEKAEQLAEKCNASGLGCVCIMNRLTDILDCRYI